MRFYVYAIVVFSVMFGAGTLAHASNTDGTIDGASRYAWSENAGWIDFGTSGGNVHVIDTALTGYAYGENIGWISLNCSNTSSCGTVNYKVANDAEGTLSGYAWSENAGWIHFAPTGGGVTINSSGNFLGYAYGENIGWIVFNCSTTSSCGTVSYKTMTDWRPESARSSGGSSGSRARASNPITLPVTTPPTTPLPTIPPVTSPLYLNQQLFPGMNNPDVLTLQQILASLGFFTVTPTGFYGPVTEAAVKAYQSAHGLPVVGVVGPLTLAALNGLPTFPQITPNPSVPLIPVVPQNTEPATFTRDLYLGSEGQDVRALQIFLNAHEFTVAQTGPGSRGQESTYFGYVTRDALMRFQKNNGITPAIGFFGALTRSFIARNF